MQGIPNQTSVKMNYPYGNNDALLISKESVVEQWNNNLSTLLTFKNLDILAEKTDIAKQNDYFTVITNPLKANDCSENSNSFGWKLHISVDRDQVSDAFDLSAHIIGKSSCHIFKVTKPECVTSDRFQNGTQITIYLEKDGKPVITAEEVLEMMAKIEAAFKKNDIKPGQKPDSDVATKSPFFSMRNDKAKHFLFPHCEYFPANISGRNFNPSSQPNPFSSLMEEGVSVYDPLEHFLSFEVDLTDFFKEGLFAFSLQSYLYEYTTLAEMDEEQQQKLICQCAISHGASIDAQFLKEEYKNSTEIMLAVRHAFSLILALTAGESKLYSFVNAYQFSEQYPFDNSFKKLIIKLEAYSKNMLEHFPLQHYEKVPCLSDLLKFSSENILETRSEQERLTFIRKGHFYLSEAALATFKYAPEYKKILHQNEDLPAVQLQLAELYKFEDPEKSEMYLLKAFLSEASNCFNRVNSNGPEILLKHQNWDELQQLSQAGNHTAMLTLALIFMRDLIPEFPYPESYNVPPIDHIKAKEYLEKFLSNVVYTMEPRERESIDELLDMLK